MKSTDGRFVMITLFSALLVGLADMVEAYVAMAPFVVEGGTVILDLPGLLIHGAALAGLSIVCAVLVANLVARPRPWTWVAAMCALTLAVEMPIFTPVGYINALITYGNVNVLPWSLVAIWLPAVLVTAMQRAQQVTDEASPSDDAGGVTVDDTTSPASQPILVGSGAVTTLVAATVAALLALALFSAAGGLQLFFGIENRWDALVTLPFATIVIAVVTAWITAGRSRADAVWLAASVVLSSIWILAEYGFDAAPLPIFSLGALTLAHVHPMIAARMQRHLLAG